MQEQFRQPDLLSKIIPERDPHTRATRLGMIIDPEEQPIEQAALRTRGFIEGGGDAILIGGSGYIEPNLFTGTVNSVAEIAYANKVPVLILPGDIGQFQVEGPGISGVLNYRDILGSSGTSFDEVYPPHMRPFVIKDLDRRGVTDISTAYVLCGDPNASVSRVTGIVPLDLSVEQTRAQFLTDIRRWIEERINCIFFESGSNSPQRVNSETVVKVREMIDSLSPETLLIVSGGIRTPDQAALYARIADIVVVGGHFEKNGVDDVGKFVEALR